MFQRGSTTCSSDRPRHSACDRHRPGSTSSDDGRLAVVRLEVPVAEHFEEVVGLRLTRLEARADAEEKALKAYFLDQQRFITFTLNRFAETLRSEWRADLTSAVAEVRLELHAVKGEVLRDLNGVKVDLDGVKNELNGLKVDMVAVKGELNDVKVEMRQVHQRIDAVEQKVDSHHDVTQRVLREILERLPPAAA
jgi:hypothetical protein